MLNSEALRRWLGMFCLAVAAGLLTWGRTVLLHYLSGRGFLLYWLVCAFFAVAAVAFGAIDLWIALRTLQHERRELAHTLDRIQRNEPDVARKSEEEIRRQG